MQSGIICGIFFLSWLAIGSAIELMLNDWRACVVVVVAIIVCVVSAALITGGDD